VQRVDEISDVVDDVVEVQVFAAAITGEQDFFKVLRDLDHLPRVRQWAVAQVVDRSDVGVRSDDAVSQLRDAGSE
jgi:hypothetical protein